jgi:peptidyl-prolyl cis-trans isomerase A (cyclophilin A)
MTTRSVYFNIFIIALGAAIASGPVIAQETKPKPPATPTAKPKPPAKPAAKPPTGQKPAATPQRGQAAGLSAAARARLRNPAKLKDVAPATFKARFDTSVGPFVIEVHRDWAPKGADRFYNLVKYGFFDGARFFRVIPRFMVQFGLNGDPSIQSVWRNANITDDPVKQSNKRGYVTFATAGPNSRTTQIFINFGDNSRLDADGFAPFGMVVSGMEAVDKINAQHREEPDQGRIQMQGNAYLNRAFPKLDYITKATIEK